ncbi:MAG TPA: protein kinase [Gemmatimonadales bacterium]|nr:protein kinase [Gemmatimonadales bacterium]
MTDSAQHPLAQRLQEALAGTYTIEGEIGRGGMGVVYRARDERLHRRVAIKVLPPELAFQEEIRARFTREAQTAARLSHPHVVPIFDVGEAGGDLVYFVMGYVDGESLAGRIKRRGQLPAEEVRRIMKETADALSAAHALSIIHRDIKPDNILLDGTRGRVMVTDFGIAKALQGGSGATLTSAGVAIGTPSYMSPEQAAGEKEIDGRSDLYSLGIVAYQMCVGQPPFAAPTVAGILMKQITEPAPMVTESRDDIPEDLALAVARCLEKDPENRWPTADALRRSLESRTAGNYQPTGTGFKAASRMTGARPSGNTRQSTGTRRPLTGTGRPTGRGLVDPLRERGNLPAPRAPRAPRPLRDRRYEQQDEENRLVRDTGEPMIIQQTRQKFVKWAAVTLGLFALNVATGLGSPWFLFPAAGMGFGLLTSYSKLWQAGYSWRDVIARPPAHDALEAKALGKGGKLPRNLPTPALKDFGNQWDKMKHAHADRVGIYALLDRMSPEDAKMLPDVAHTVDGLYQRASDLGRTLAAMETTVATGEVPRVEQRLQSLLQEPQSEDRDRKEAMLRRQLDTITGIQKRYDEMKSHFESCVLAVQTMRYDLLRLRSQGINSVANELTQATQAAKALSRDVDLAIEAAGEMREAMK